MTISTCDVAFEIAARTLATESYTDESSFRSFRIKPTEPSAAPTYSSSDTFLAAPSIHEDRYAKNTVPQTPRQKPMQTPGRAHAHTHG